MIVLTMDCKSLYVCLHKSTNIMIHYLHALLKKHYINKGYVLINLTLVLHLLLLKNVL